MTAQDKDYTAYAKDFYQTGESVTIDVIRGKKAKIVTEEELKESQSLLK